MSTATAMHEYRVHPPGRGGLLWLASLAWLKSASRLTIRCLHLPACRLKSVSRLTAHLTDYLLIVKSCRRLTSPVIDALLRYSQHFFFSWIASWNETGAPLAKIVRAFLYTWYVFANSGGCSMYVPNCRPWGIVRQVASLPGTFSPPQKKKKYFG